MQYEDSLTQVFIVKITPIAMEKLSRLCYTKTMVSA